MGFKILIADDEKDIVEMLSAFFSGKGYTPAFAKCNSQAKSDPVQGQ